jgi:hypothetical protein
MFIGAYLFFAFCTTAQHYEFKQLSSSEGLVGSSVYSSIEDTAGFIWFATNRTISRYDGKNFTHYGKAEGYTEEGAYLIYRDKKNTIWVISFNFKLFYFDGTKFVRFATIPDACWLCEDDDGLFHVATRKNVIYSLKSKKIVQSRPVKSNSYIFNFIAIDNVKLLYSDGSNVYVHDGKDSRLILASTCDLFIAPPRMLKLVNGDALISDCGNIYYFDTKTEKLTLCFTQKDMLVVGFFEDRENQDIMIATNQGVFKFPQGKLHLAPMHFLKDQIIYGIAKSAEGIYWFCSGNGGVFNGNFLARHFTKQDGLLADVQFIRASNGQVFFSSPVGYIGVLKDNGLTITLKTLIPSFYSHINKAIKLPSGEVHFINKGTNHVQHKALPNTYQYGNRRYLLFDNQEVLFYVENVNGFPRYSYVKTNKPVSEKVISPNFILKNNAMFRTPNALIGDSVFVYLYDKGYITATIKKTGVYYIKYPVPNMTLSHVITTPSGNLVFATKANGIVMKTAKGNLHISTANGLISNYCTNVYFENNQLWVSTEQGLSRIKFTSTADEVYSIENYTSDDFLISDNVKDIGVTDSLVYVATDKGISIFNPNKFAPRHDNPRVYIKSSTINSSKVNHLQPFIVPYDQNNLTIYYEAITMRKALPVNYRYRLIGIDTGFTYTKENNVNYAKLPAGKYEFIVYASTAKKVWSKYPAIIRFTVTEAFWQTTWFSVLLIGFIVLIIFTVIQRRYALLKTTQENEKRRIESELKALRLQMNPHFIFNTLNSLQKFILQYKPIEANKYIAKFSRLMRWILAYSDKQQITLQEELEFLNLYIELEQLRFVNTFSCKISLDETINKQSVLMPSLIIQPFIENAIKYGLTEKNKTEKGILQVIFKTADNLLYVTITDNGVGRDIIKQRQKLEINKPESTGIKSTTERLVILHANKVANPVVITDLFDDKGYAVGTKVELIIPLKYA